MKRWVWAALVLIVAGCATKPVKEAPVAAPPPGPAALAPINRNLSPLQAAWHVRSALNVAALSCVNYGGAAMVQGYNRMLQVQKTELARAYADQLDRYRAQYGAAGQRELDRQMTKLYNYFAWPPSQPAFCEVAGKVVQEAVAVPPGGFAAFAPDALARIDAPFVNPTTRLASRAMATPTRTAVAAAPAAAVAAPGDWRIQLGAFTGQAAAEAAWAKIRARATDLHGYAPRYQPVPGRPGLVRLQLATKIARGDALKLCALAAASGFDCLPVAA